MAQAKPTEWLLNSTNINTLNEDGVTPLIAAIKHPGHYLYRINAQVISTKNTIASLLEAKALPNTRDKSGYTPLQWAADRKSIHQIQLLLDARASASTADTHNDTPRAIAEKSIKELKEPLSPNEERNLGTLYTIVALLEAAENREKDAKSVAALASSLERLGSPISGAETGTQPVAPGPGPASSEPQPAATTQAPPSSDVGSPAPK